MCFRVSDVCARKDSCVFLVPGLVCFFYGRLVVAPCDVEGASLVSFTPLVSRAGKGTVESM